ncbi:unnamed protein product, partial [marine sediment metagenome]
KIYFVDSGGFIQEIQKRQDGFSSRILNPTRKGIPRVINIPPPKPFKDWESYEKAHPIRESDIEPRDDPFFFNPRDDPDFWSESNIEETEDSS